MGTVSPDINPKSQRSRSFLLFIEWLALLTGVLLCLPTKSYYIGLNLALLLLMISWGARWLRLRYPTRSTPLDVPLLLFLLSLLISYFAAPHAPTAFTRLSLFLGAISFFYTLVNSTSRSINRVLTLLIILLVFTSLILISQYDWLVEPTRFSVTRTIGIQLNQIIPNLGITLPPWNVLRNILASLFGVSIPFLLLQIYRVLNVVRKLSGFSREKRSSWVKFVLLMLLAFLILLNLTLTESRTPWLVYFAIFVLTIWWWISQLVGEQIRIPHSYAFLGGIVLIALFMLVFNSILPQDLNLISLLPGPDTITGRTEIYPQSAYLADDTPYTGGGLGAFTALYSFYIRVVPVNVFTSEDTGNNLYMYVLVEQGWLGFLCLVFFLIIPFYLGLVHIDHADIADRGLVAAGLIGVSFIIMWGFFHAILVASRAIPFLLLPAGLIFAGSRTTQRESVQSLNSKLPRLIPGNLALLAIPTLLFLAYLLVAKAPRSAWYANLGAIQMARIQLAGWPTGVWEDGSNLPSLIQAEALFQKSLDPNPRNRTANHRLGLIAMLRQDFSSATQYLETAYQITPQHRGVIKSLGYALVWNGEIERAIELLRMIPEAAQEMGVYIFWWNNLGRPDLSAQAQEAQKRLQEAP